MSVETGSRYRVHPALRSMPIDASRVEISAPFGTKRLRFAREIGARLERLSIEPSFARETLVKAVGTVIFEALVKYHFVLPEDASPALIGGLCVPTAQPAGQPLSVFDIETLCAGDAVLLHAPIQTTANSSVSVAAGGQRVRSQLAQSLRHPLGGDGQGVVIDLDFGAILHTKNLRLFDLGDVSFRPSMDSAQDVGERLRYVCRRIVESGGRPIVLGGDHAQAFYSIDALADRYPHLGVLQFDAHPDLYAMGAPCDAELNHANVMHWIRRMKHVASIWQVGVRDFFHQPTLNLRCEADTKIQSLSAFEAETQGYGRLLAQMDRSLPWFISFDVDALSHADFPQTTTPVLGGLSFYRLLACFEQLLSTFDIVGMEFVEIGDADHGAHDAAAVAARLVSRYLFHLGGAGPHGSFVYTPAP
ncbi:agmatinase [Trinickia violacea]|uniref:Agmatinase n=1 Tax=Trinickia violacea TaxID=2571746 RepID=A0A4P8IJM0_9BURK|nr:arginase family protein [Trinickia violacea]QCP48992.1 agmatinase [Trinickia violacea]